MVWSYKQIRKNSWNTVFRKGVKAWFFLVIVCFVFSFIGASNGSQTSIVDFADGLLESDDTLLNGNIDYLKDYIVNTSLVKHIPFLSSDFVLRVIDSLSRSVPWVVRLFARNTAYFERNPGEVIANMLIAAVITAAIHFLFQNVVIIGRNRYVLENRFQKEVPVRRIFAPFHKENTRNIIWVMFRYYIALLLWSVTIVGGVYKSYQYSMIPYILAENPSVKWKEAKKLSMAMTKGYKWKMFCTQLSYLYIWILKTIPIAGLCVAVPLEVQLNIEFYCTLRSNPAIDRELFVESAFSGTPYIHREKSEKDAAPEYILQDLNLRSAHSKEKFRFGYSLTDFIFFFFSFCLIGWLWEVGLYLVEDHMFVNRGTLYGPWIPIYGVGGVAIVFLLDRFKAHKGKLFLMAVLLCAALEYLASFALDFLFNASYWDYKTMFLNVNGRICLAGLVAFGLGGLFGIYIAAPLISRFVSRFSKKTQYIVCGILCAAFIADLLCCFIFGFNSGSGVGGRI